PNEDPIGKRIKLGGRDPDNQKLEVIGVVGRVKMESLGRDDNRVQGYFPYLQMPDNGMTVIIKARSEPNELDAHRNGVERRRVGGAGALELDPISHIRGHSVGAGYCGYLRGDVVLRHT